MTHRSTFVLLSMKAMLCRMKAAASSTVKLESQQPYSGVHPAIGYNVSTNIWPHACKHRKSLQYSRTDCAAPVTMMGLLTYFFSIFSRNLEQHSFSVQEPAERHMLELHVDLGPHFLRSSTLHGV